MNGSASNTRSLATNYESDDSKMAGLHDNQGMSGENLEKSLTNLNIHIALIAEQRQQLASTLKVFCENFSKQQGLVDEDIKQLRIEMAQLRKATQGGV